MNDTNTDKDVVTRFAPSPTGQLHVGGARTALFNWLVAQQSDGRMILRFEDTDQKRSKKQYADDIKEGFDWLSLDYHGPYRQSERNELYKTYIEQLIADNFAYRSDESNTEGERDEVIRFDNPNKEVSFVDEIRGEITVDTTDLGDFVIAKDTSNPLYHLAVVIDDHEMGVTHVIRGDEHISNTPRQLLLIEAIGADRPTYAHIPLIHGNDGKKLSKRHGATALTEFRKAGYLPEGMINYLALLGWHPQDGQEIFAVDDLIDTFELSRVQKGPATFSYEKLRWVNREHVKQLDEESLFDGVRSYLPEDIKTRDQFTKSRLRKALPAIRDRIETFGDVTKLAESGELSFFFTAPDYSATDLIWDDNSPEETKQYLQAVKARWEQLSDDEFDEGVVKSAVWEYASDTGRGDVLWPTRFALSGQDESPGPFVIASIIGKNETLNRLDTAISKLEK